MRRSTRTPAAWTFLLAFVLATLAPVVARAAALGGPPGAAVCSADGAPRAPALPHALDHCPCCSTAAPALAPPPAEPCGRAVATAAPAPPPLAARSGRPVLPWRLAAARAPPAVA